MKKFAVFMCVMAIGSSAAFAASVNIPFYAEFGATDAFIGVQNVGSTNQTVTVIYFHAASTGGELGGTFKLAPGESVSFQPFKDTGGNEVQPAGITDASVASGSVLIETSGSTSEVVGRYVQLTATSAFAHNVSIS
jgi:membrane peptidoglycan carboxypeptidase